MPAHTQQHTVCRVRAGNRLASVSEKCAQGWWQMHLLDLSNNHLTTLPRSIPAWQVACRLKSFVLFEHSMILIDVVLARE